VLAIDWADAIAAHVIEGPRLEPQEDRGLNDCQIGRRVAIACVATHQLDEERVQVPMCGGFRCRKTEGLLVICHDIPCRNGHRPMMKKIGSVREWRLQISCKRHGCMPGADVGPNGDLRPMR
jgi:hypothetical protein